MANLTVYRGMKLTKDLALKLEVAAREKGFSSPNRAPNVQRGAGSASDEFCLSKLCEKIGSSRPRSRDVIPPEPPVITLVYAGA